MTRRRSRRILGMTVAQLLILACMGCALVGTLGTGAWMMASANGISLAWPTRVVPPTASPSPTPLPTFTVTPLPTLTPTATPIPYTAYVPAGWRQYKSEKVEVWLPDTFAFVDNPSGFDQELNDKYSLIGLTDYVKQREKNLTVYELLFRHGPPLGSHFIPTVFVKEFSRNGLSLAQFTDKAVSVLDVNSTLVERKPFAFFEREGERVVVQTNFNNVYVNFVYYLVQDGNTIWEIGCDASLADYYTFEPVFDDIARTFRPVNGP